MVQTLMAKMCLGALVVGVILCFAGHLGTGIWIVVGGAILGKLLGVKI